jgi:hypothetical protein
MAMTISWRPWVFACCLFLWGSSADSRAQGIAYEIHTTQLKTAASFEQPGCPASKTIDGILDESFWAVMGNVDAPNYIMWRFGSPQTLDRMQIVNDGHFNHPHNLVHFSLFYSTRNNPGLTNEADWMNLPVSRAGNFGAEVRGNEIKVTRPAPHYYIRWEAVAGITAIRLMAYPIAGNHSNGNFVLNEVSFNDGPSRRIDETVIFGADVGDGEDSPADLVMEPDADAAMAATPRLIYWNYQGVWEDTQRAHHQLTNTLPAEIRFLEPPQSSTAFQIDKAQIITRITTFHWYGGNGANPGAIQIEKMDGGYQKSWPASGARDFTGSRTVYWVIEPNERLEPGTYYVNAIPKATWSCNKRSQLKGIVKVEGYAADSGGGPVTGGGTPVVREYPLTPGQAVTGQVEAKSQIHKYSFRAEAGKCITVTIEAGASLGVRADLKDPSRKRVGRKLAKPAPKPGRFTWTATQTGIYEVWVWAKNTQLRTGSYRLGVSLQ